MVLREIKLTHYKNYQSQKLVFHPEMTVLVGDNGMGKTNILDAVYYLCLGKSYFSGQDKYVVQEGAEFTRLEGRFVGTGGQQKVVVKVKPRKLKEIELNGKKHDRLVDHIGHFSCVVIAPIDVQMMLESSAQRRRFINNTIIQYDPQYTQALMTYNRVLKQRNALLKQMAESRTFNTDLLDSYTLPLLAPAQYIYDTRKALAETLTVGHSRHYQQLSGGREETVLRYRSDLDSEESFVDLLKAAAEKDKVLARTTVGIHKDDIEMEMAGRSLKFYGSQGQLKSYILAMKLTQYDILCQQSTTPPILLLDDVFDKLDRNRVTNLLSVVQGEAFGQVIITDTSVDRVPNLLQELGQDFTSFVVKDGVATAS